MILLGATITDNVKSKELINAMTWEVASTWVVVDTWDLNSVKSRIQELSWEIQRNQAHRQDLQTEIEWYYSMQEALKRENDKYREEKLELENLVLSSLGLIVEK